MLCIAHENADEIQNITNLEFGDQLWTKFLLFFLIWNGSNRFSRFTLCHFHVLHEKIQTINKFRRLCLWCDVALCLLNPVFTTNESRSAEMSFGFQHLTLLESATHMTPNERFSPHEMQWNSRKFVVEWDEYGEMHKMMEKYHQKNNLNLCIFPISASKIFIMLKSQLKNIERGTCFIVVVNSMHQCYWFYRWIVWRVRCQMWSVWNVSVSPKSSNVLFFFFTLCSFSWTSWNSTSKSAELEMCYGKTQNQNTIKTKRINSKLVKNWLKSYRKTLIEWEIVEIVVKCKCVNVFWLCWKNKWCTISRIIEMD